MAEHHIHVVGGDDEDEQITLIDEQVRTTCRLICIVRGEKVIADEADFFRALQAFRRRALEPLGLVPFCYGASLNVWPSAMGRDMGLGLKAYKVEKGARAGELVSIFGEGPDIIPSRVAQQEEFARDWLSSLAGR